MMQTEFESFNTSPYWQHVSKNSTEMYGSNLPYSTISDKWKPNLQRGQHRERIIDQITLPRSDRTLIVVKNLSDDYQHLGEKPTLRSKQISAFAIPAKVRRPPVVLPPSNQKIPGLMDRPITPPPNVKISPPKTETDPTLRPNRVGCWNCGEKGHGYSECPQPRGKKFCYRCGIPCRDVHTCPICPERSVNQPPGSREGKRSQIDTTAPPQPAKRQAMSSST